MRDWKKFPELRNEEFPFYYLESPHKQITESFFAKCEKVHDGDTITLKWSERKFTFPVRFLDIDAPELSNPGGFEARDFVKSLIEGEEVYVQVDKENRVDKWGRLLGRIFSRGMNVGEMEMSLRYSVPFEERRQGMLPTIDKIADLKTWF